jgi:hypothetical protein
MSVHPHLADIRRALGQLPLGCRYHDDIEPAWGKPWHYSGACCATGEPALLRRRAVASLDRIAEALTRGDVS